MKIIQSFWSGGRNLLSNSFGWYSPQHHLMSWALSCLQLNQFYTDIELYTDANGYELLIKELKLPYTKVHVALDELNCYPSELWALGKIKAYEKQAAPFIHVDGDVFIWKRFDERIHNGELIVQNLEKATDYYRTKFQDIQKSLNYVHPIIDFDFYDKSACACNAGIIGGTDFTFFKRYASEVFHFINRNDLTKIPPHTLINFNMLFEQVLFYHQVQAESKEVTTLFDTIFNDNGYKYEEIADFTTVPFQNTYLHLIGPHKRNKTAPDLMSRMLLRDYPDYYFSIVSLFNNPPQNRFVISDVQKAAVESTTSINKSEAALPDVIQQRLSTYAFRNSAAALLPEEQLTFLTNEAKKYEAALTDAKEKFQAVSYTTLLARDVQSLNDFRFFYQSRDEQLTTVLQTEPVIKIIDTTYDWTLFKKEEADLSGIANTTENSLVRIAYLPEVDFPYYQEIALEELDYYILCLAESPTTLETILKELETCFNTEDLESNYDNFFQLIMLKIKHLIVNKCLLIADNNSGSQPV